MPKFLIVGSLDPFGMMNIGVERPEDPMTVNRSHVKVQSSNIEVVIDFGWDNGYVPVYHGLVVYTPNHPAKKG